MSNLAPGRTRRPDNITQAVNLITSIMQESWTNDLLKRLIRAYVQAT